MKTFYTYNLETYCGTQLHPNFQVSNSPHDLVLRLVEPIKKTGRNITADNWFTSLPLVSDLADIDLSYLGTVRKSKRQIPPQFQPIKSRAYGSSLFGFHRTDKNLTVTLVSYIPEKKKNKKKAVVLMSTLHDDDEVDHESPKHKPRMILDYNNYKCGVDVVDQMCANYSVQRTSRRWPWTVMSNLANISGINGYVIFKKITSSKITRHSYLQNLCRALVFPHLAVRAKTIQLKTETRRLCLALTSPTLSVTIPMDTKVCQDIAQTKCEICKTENTRRNTRHCCLKCKKPVCSAHMYLVCFKCVDA